MSEKVLTHIDERGRAHMVNVGAKPVTERRAVALAKVEMDASTLELVLEGGANKGDVLGTARLAGIMAAKRTGDLIPLCHPLPLSSAAVAFAPGAASGAKATLWIKAEATCQARTGVEMEAMTAASIAALTVYDMCKAVDRGMTVGALCLWQKSGGRSGDFERAGVGALDLPAQELWR